MTDHIKISSDIEYHEPQFHDSIVLQIKNAVKEALVESNQGQQRRIEELEAEVLKLKYYLFKSY